MTDACSLALMIDSNKLVNMPSRIQLLNHTHPVSYTLQVRSSRFWRRERDKGGHLTRPFRIFTGGSPPPPLPVHQAGRPPPLSLCIRLGQYMMVWPGTLAISIKQYLIMIWDGFYDVCLSCNQCVSSPPPKYSSRIVMIGNI
jgi:hypothetical protein